MNQTPDIIIAGGKTGGHLFPGIAVAQAVQRMAGNVAVRFVGTDAPFEKKTLARYGFSHTSISARPIKGGSMLQKIRSVFSLCIAFLQAAWIIFRNRPGFVLGVGGFSSFAVVTAAWLFRVPTAIQEQNAFPGLTNRMLAGFAGTIFTAFEGTRGFSERSNTVHTGNPVRKTSRTRMDKPDTPDFIDPSKQTILITGGSQGASSINHAMIDALKLMKNAPGRFNIIHQTGMKEAGKIQQAYLEMQITAETRAFFDDLPALEEKADLVIARAGAGTLFELCAKGCPAIFVPYPYAADDHQTFNARALEKKGAAVVIPDADLDGPGLLKVIEDLTGDPDTLKQMGEKMRAFALPNADEKIAAHILSTMGLKG